MVADLLCLDQALRFDSASDYEFARPFTKHELAKSPKELVYAGNQVVEQASMIPEPAPPLLSRYVSHACTGPTALLTT